MMHSHMNNFTVTGYVCKVLILVVMDDALARLTYIPLSNDSSVLILVVMDDALAQKT